MVRQTFLYLSVAALLSMAAVTIAAAQQPKLSAADIVNKNIAARGGLQQWRAVQTITLTGKMQAGGNNRPTVPMPQTRFKHGAVPPRPETQVELPFKMELKRNRKLRVELQFAGQTAVQVYDGANGWKLRPFLNRSDYEPYTSDESKSAANQSDLDGPLVDYAAKGTTVVLDGNEKVDNRDNYRLKLTLKNGYSFHVWVDAQTFLETKMEGTPRRLDGQFRPVEVYFSDYRQTNGVMIPHVLETRVKYDGPRGPKQSSATTERVTIETAVVNAKLDDSLFTPPKSEVATSAPHAINAPAQKAQ